MKEHVLIVCLDACKRDYLSSKAAPYLHGLIDDALFYNSETILAFPGIAATIYSGTYPDVHGVWTLFYYEPRSMYKMLLPLTQMIALVDKVEIPKKHFRCGLTAFANLLRRSLGLSHPVSVYEIPADLLKYFDVSIRKCLYETKALPVTTLFDLLYANGLRTLCIDWPLISVNGLSKISFSLKHSDRGEFEKARKILFGSNHFDVSFIQFHDLDKVTHERGTGSPITIEKVKELDYFLEKLVEGLSRKYERMTTIVYSDHGAVDVHRKLDVMELLDGCNLILKRDYLFFLDSTMARFWFFNEKARRIITNVLGDLDGGYLLTMKDRKDLRLPVANNYGEEVLLADPGVQIYPNFYQGYAMAKGMHGYNPACNDMDGFFLLCDSAKTKQSPLQSKMKLVDWFPTVLDVFDIPYPPTCEGKSVLSPVHR